MGIHTCFARWGASRTLKHVFIYTTAAKELAAKELAPSRIRLFSPVSRHVPHEEGGGFIPQTQPYSNSCGKH